MNLSEERLAPVHSDAGQLVLATRIALKQEPPAFSLDAKTSGRPRRAGLPVENRNGMFFAYMGPVSEFSVENIALPPFDLHWYRSTANDQTDLSRIPVTSYSSKTRPYRALMAELSRRIAGLQGGSGTSQYRNGDNVSATPRPCPKPANWDMTPSCFRAQLRQGARKPGSLNEVMFGALPYCLTMLLMAF